MVELYYAPDDFKDRIHRQIIETLNNFIDRIHGFITTGDLLNYIGQELIILVQEVIEQQWWW